MLRHPGPSPEATHFSKERLGYHRPWCWRDETTEITGIKEVEKYTSASQAQQGLRSVPAASTTLEINITKLSAKDWQFGRRDSFFLPTRMRKSPRTRNAEKKTLRQTRNGVLIQSRRPYALLPPLTRSFLLLHNYHAHLRPNIIITGVSRPSSSDGFASSHQPKRNAT